MCTTHPGFDPDLVISTDSVSLMRVFSGLDDWAEATARGTVRVAGPPRLVRAFPTWFLWSPFREAVRAAISTTP